MNGNGSAKTFEETSYLYGGNAAFIEDLYSRYLRDPDSVDGDWRRYFALLQEGIATPPRAMPAAARRVPSWAHRPIARAVTELEGAAADKEAAVQRLIAAYRMRGHQVAEVDPLKLRTRPDIPDLDPAFYHLTGADLDRLFNTGSLAAPDRLPLREIVAILREVYCGALGAEYMHILDAEERAWLQRRLEEGRHRRLPAALRRQLLERLIAAEGLERYLHTKYVGQKRFSLEGGRH